MGRSVDGSTTTPQDHATTIYTVEETLSIKRGQLGLVTIVLEYKKLD